MVSRLPPPPLLGDSAEMRRLRTFVLKAAKVEVPVLLVGETGTGKSHVARVIHSRSARSNHPFVGVNCAGVPESLFESEFFGHERGSFTGATDARQGFFALASRGTLFLDELGELPISQQSKLLSALEDSEVRRVGGSRPVPVDVRVVSATCRDLGRALGERSFRQDLFHRVALLRCEIPPLRRRPHDVVPLARHFLGRLATKYLTKGGSPGLDEGARQLLLRHPWPGNVRELAHALEAAVILSDTTTLRREHLERVLGSADPADVGERKGSHTRDAGALPQRPRRGRYSFFGSQEEERELIRGALVEHGGNRTRAAEALGMARNTLRVRMRRYDLDRC